MSDLLSELLLSLRLRGMRYRRIRAMPPFGLRFPEAPSQAHFHFVAAGRAFLHCEDGSSRELGPGAAVFLPRGRPHLILSDPEPPCACRDIRSFDAETLCSEVAAVATARDADPGTATLLFSGAMEIELGGMQALVPLMPEAMLVDTLSGRHPEILPILQAMEAEACAERVGFAGILARLAEIIATTIVRAWVEDGAQGAPGLFAALRDSRLSRPIALLHRDPGRDWTVEALATEAGVSRSVFAARFLSVLGMPPLRYAAELRMQLARHWLRSDRVPIQTVARRLGYASQAAFSRAFKRVTGESPAASREPRSRPGRISGSAAGSAAATRHAPAPPVPRADNGTAWPADRPARY